MNALGEINVDQLVSDTCELIRARSENPGGVEALTVAVLQEMCERIGATAQLQEIAPGRPNLFATLGPEDGPAILFLGHSDVVPAGEGWSADPFEPRVEGGSITGRGATDMKGGLAAVVAAMEQLAVLEPSLRLELLCTVDEEDRAQGVQAWLATQAPREYLACIVAEPTDLEIVIACRGAVNLHVEVLGASAHAGRPEDGASSIYGASCVIEHVRACHEEAASGDRDPLLGVPTWNVGTISGGSGTSMVPRVTQLTLDRRTMPGEDPATILEELLLGVQRDLTDSGIANARDLRVEGFIEMVMPGFRTDPATPLVASAIDALTGLGIAPKVTGWTAACEGGFVAAHHSAPTIILGPGDINTQAHQPNESVEVAQLLAAADAYVAIGRSLFAGAVSSRQTLQQADPDFTQVDFLDDRSLGDLQKAMVEHE